MSWWRVRAPLYWLFGLLPLRLSSALEVSTSLISGTSFGDIALNGTATINLDSGGNVTYSTDKKQGRPYVLNSTAAFYSPFISSAACALCAFESTSSNVDAFLTTRDNLNTTIREGVLDYNRIQPVKGGYWKNTRSGSRVLPLNASETYAFVVINMNASNSDIPTNVTYRLRGYVYDKTAGVCNGSDASGGDPPDPSVQPFYEEVTSPAKSAVTPYAVIESASCISFQLLAQSSKNLSSLNLTYFVNSINSTTNWAASKFASPVPYLGVACVQTLNTSQPSSSLVSVNSSATVKGADNATVTQLQSCQVNINGLNLQQQYILWGINNSTDEKGDRPTAVVRYKARLSGTCDDVTFPKPTSVSFVGSQTSPVNWLRAGKLRLPSPEEAPSSALLPAPRAAPLSAQSPSATPAPSPSGS